MKTDSASRTRVRFGIFEADLRSGELRRDGLKVKIQELPFQVLVALLERSGEVVTREALRKRLWPADTFVDFEHGLNKAINKLREALGDDAGNPRFVETLPRRGYRFIGPTEAEVGSRDRRPDAVRMIAFSAGVIASVLMALFALNVAGLRDRVMRMFSPHINSIAVLPVENLSGDPSQDNYADGMTDELITTFGSIGALRVIGRTSVMGYKGSDKPIREIASELNVDAVIESTMLNAGNRPILNVRLVDGSKERILWKDTYERDRADKLILSSEVASGVARKIGIKLTPEERQRLASTPPVKPRAYDAYLLGRYFLGERTGDDVRKALEYFKDAAEIDPNFAPAHAGIADAYVTLAYYGPIPPAEANAEARKAALQAIALDDKLAEAHDSLAEVYFHYDWDWAGAESEFRRAIALNKSYVKARDGYSWFLMAVGRYDEAIAQAEEAQRLDPNSEIIETTFGAALFYSGRYNEAIRQWESIRKSNPDFWVARSWLGFGYLAKGLNDQAQQELETAVKLSEGNPNSLAFLGYGYARSGRAAKAHRILERLRQKAKKSYVSPYQFAIVHAALGEKDPAIEDLQKALQQHYTLMVGVNRQPVFQPLHSDPRFQALVRRMHFPPKSRNTRP